MTYRITVTCNMLVFFQFLHDKLMFKYSIWICDIDILEKLACDMEPHPMNTHTNYNGQWNNEKKKSHKSIFILCHRGMAHTGSKMNNEIVSAKLPGRLPHACMTNSSNRPIHHNNKKNVECLPSNFRPNAPNFRLF